MKNRVCTCTDPLREASDCPYRGSGIGGHSGKKYSREAPFGWTVVRDVHAEDGKFIVYKRDHDPCRRAFSDDLIPFTFHTKAEAIQAGKAGIYAYRNHEDLAAAFFALSVE